MHTSSSTLPQQALKPPSAAGPYDTPDTSDSNRGRTTRQFATDYLVQPQSVRKRYSETGSYFGVVPQKLYNGRLKWPA